MKKINKQAIMVIGHGNDYSVLQETINILDNNYVDFFVHWDKEYKRPNLTAKDSKIYFINSINVGWGTDSLMQVELNLLSAVKKTEKYKMAHLISSADMPLMDSDYFIKYFNGKRSYLGFSHNNTDDFSDRIKYYWPKFSLRNKKVLSKLIFLCNRLFNINRLKNTNIEVKKGPQWFSINTNLIDRILNYDKKNFFYSYCVDEIFMQTILADLDTNIQNANNDNAQAARYIDWKRGTPYIFSAKDVEELKKVKNTKYAFARKVTDSNIIKNVFN